MVTMSRSLSLERSSVRRKVANIVRAMVATALLAGLLGCNVIRPWPAFESSATRPDAKKQTSANEWIGKTLPELTTNLGQPTSVQPLLETTGQLIIYGRPGQSHYVFETGPNGKIVSASASD